MSTRSHAARQRTRNRTQGYLGHTLQCVDFMKLGTTPSCTCDIDALLDDPCGAVGQNPKPLRATHISGATTWNSCDCGLYDTNAECAACSEPYMYGLGAVGQVPYGPAHTPYDVSTYTNGGLFNGLPDSTSYTGPFDGRTLDQNNLAVYTLLSVPEPEPEVAPYQNISGLVSIATAHDTFGLDGPTLVAMVAHISNPSVPAIMDTQCYDMLAMVYSTMIPHYSTPLHSPSDIVNMARIYDRLTVAERAVVDAELPSTITAARIQAAYQSIGA